MIGLAWWVGPCDSVGVVVDVCVFDGMGLVLRGGML